MRVPRLYVNASLSTESVVQLDEDASRYVGKVLRLDAGNAVRLFNSTDGEFAGAIVEAGRKSISVHLHQSIACSGNPTLPVHIGLGLSRGERMDFAIQKATELGVTSLTPLFTERCEVKLGEDRADKRLHHWQRIAISACEQCGRTRVPAIGRPISLAEWLLEERAGSSFVLDHLGSKGFPAASPSAVTLLIGPEGGLSQEEVGRAQASRFESVCLGPRVLRTETAPMVALSVVQHLWGDF